MLLREQRGQSCASLGVLLVSGHVQHRGVHNLVFVLRLPVVIHKLHVGVDQVDDDGVVDNVVLILVFRTFNINKMRSQLVHQGPTYITSTIINPKSFARCLDLLLSSSQSDQARVELLDVLLHLLHSVPQGIHSDKQGLDLAKIFCFHCQIIDLNKRIQ